MIFMKKTAAVILLFLSFFINADVCAFVGDIKESCKNRDSYCCNLALKLGFYPQEQLFPAPELSLEWPVYATKLSSCIGPRRLGFHQGIDVPLKEGTEVAVVAKGSIKRIIHAESDPICGNGIVIDHGKGIETVYCHFVKHRFDWGSEGREVRKGETIGYVGSTGRSTGPHLHLGVKVNGVFKNPLCWLPKRSLDTSDCRYWDPYIYC
ncbi:M23 family metallopeptidase [Candidatus Micrarchaeota archaeon]|nr:M23 family metallopeptidase [Candidatus Micrarchaeota archaeon]